MDPNIPAQPVFQPEPQIPQQPVQPVNPSPNKPSKAKRILLLVLGVLEIFFPVIGLYLMFSLLDLQHTLGINLIKSIFGIVFFAITILLAVFQIIAGIFGLEVKLGNGKIKGLMITGIILAVFTIPAIMLFIIYPTYNAVSTENSPSPSPTTMQTLTPVPTPTPNPTANWKTFVNTKYGYSIKYPPDFELDTSSDIAPCKDLTSCSLSNYVSFNSVEKFGTVEPLYYSVGVDLLSNPSGQDLKTLLTQDLPPDIKSNFILNQDSINNTFVYKTTSLPSRSGEEHVYFKQISGNDYIELVFGPYDPQQPFPEQAKFYSIFNQILSTFKFTDQISQTLVTPTPDPTANWPVYVNTKIGFQVKYPSRYPKPELPSGAPGSPTLYADENTDNNNIIFGTNSTDSFSISVFPFSGNLDSLMASPQATNTRPFNGSPLSQFTTTTNEITVGGVRAQWLISSYKEGSLTSEKHNNIYFTNKNHGFIINTWPDYNVTELNQILSTFKFTQ